ncbi:MAG: type II toxin-antitoxin system VapC family toxin [Burkholderiales bacterium]|nr:type II toxin-antitoxin system VapC family toxin [Phycisphaerae bacterium]
MTVILDSSAWIEMFSNDRNATAFMQVVSESETILVPSVVIYEVYRYALRLFGAEKAQELWGTMTQQTVVDLDANLAAAAAEIAHTLKLAMADAIILATARHYAADLWTQDADLKGLDGVRYVEKKSSPA